MEHGAALNSINYVSTFSFVIVDFLFRRQRGETPFMLACKSSVDRSLKVRFFGEEGANCQAEDRVRLTTILCSADENSPPFLIRRDRLACSMPLGLQRVKMT